MRGDTLKYEEEVLSHVGSAGDAGFDEIRIVVFQPHKEVELTTIGLDTPRRPAARARPEVAAALAAHLAAAPAALEAALIKTREEEPEGESGCDALTTA